MNENMLMNRVLELAASIHRLMTARAPRGEQWDEFDRVVAYAETVREGLGSELKLAFVDEFNRLDAQAVETSVEIRGDFGVRPGSTRYALWTGANWVVKPLSFYTTDNTRRDTEE